MLLVMKLNKSQMHIPFVLGGVFLLPSFLYVVFNLSSPGVGLVASVVLMLTISLVGIQKAKVSRNVVKTTFLIFLILFLYSLPSVFYGELKPVISLVLTFPIVFYIFYIFNLIDCSTDRQFLSSIKLLCIIFTILGIFGAFFNADFLSYNSKPKNVFPFSEPGHYAVIAGLLFVGLAMCLKKRFKYVYVILILFLAISFPNLTFSIYALIIVFLSNGWFKSYIYLFTIILLSFIFISFNPDLNEYFLSRILITSDNNNLTALVYVQGWQEMLSALKYSNFFGVGFQMNGVQPASDMAEKIRQISGIYKNRDDGAFLAGKIISEFGVVGLVFVFYMIKEMLKSAIFLKRNYSRVHLNKAVTKTFFSHGVIVAFSVELLLRGNAYFSPSFILFLTCCLYVNFKSGKV